MSGPRRTPDIEFASQTALELDHGTIELCKVMGEQGEAYFDLGSADNDGTTLVRVRVMRGAKDDGPEYWCQLSAPAWFIPSPGTVVHVSLPAGVRLLPGVPMIIGQQGKSPVDQFGTNDGKDVVFDFGPDRRVIFKAGKGVILSDYEDRWLGLGPTLGIAFGDASASGMTCKAGKLGFFASQDQDAKAILQLSATDGVLLTHKDPAGDKVSAIKMKAGNCTIACKAFSAACANAMIGANATPVSAAQYGPGVGLPSTSVFISP